MSSSRPEAPPGPANGILSGDLDDPVLAALWERLGSAASEDPFALLPYARVISETQGLRPRIHATTGSGKTSGGGLITFWRKRRGLSELLLPGYTPHNPAILPGDSEAAVADRRSVLDVLAPDLEAAADLVRLELPPTVADLRPLRWRGWDVTPRWTYQVDLTDTPGSRWSQNARRNLKKAGGDYRLRTLDDPAPVVALCAASYERQGGALPLGRSVVGRMASAAVRARLARVFVVEDAAGAAAAGLVALETNTTAAYWLAGSLPGPAMTVLLGRIFEQFGAEGKRIFEFVGANTPSIAEFKRRFGPRLVPYYRATFVRSRWIRAAQALRSAP